MPRLHVTGLPSTLTEAGLRELFTPFGTVLSAKTIKDSHGDSIGFGIVEMSCVQEVDEILNTKDRISVAGNRPYIWKPPDFVPGRNT
jgi:RNA recognition motif-containing protein